MTEKECRTDDTMHLKEDNVMLIVSERREMKDNIWGGSTHFFSESKYRYLVVRMVGVIARTT